MIEYKTAKFIKTILESELDRNQTKLKKMKKDKNCSVEIYENTLDMCNKLEYAIEKVERIIK